jgi:hypothetical protein
MFRASSHSFQAPAWSLASRLLGILKEKGWGNGFEKQLALKFSIK